MTTMTGLWEAWHTPAAAGKDARVAWPDNSPSIHIVEETVLVLVSALFVVGLLGMLFGA
jgi:hypothetical protein